MAACPAAAFLAGAFLGGCKPPAAAARKSKPATPAPKSRRDPLRYRLDLRRTLAVRWQARGWLIYVPSLLRHYSHTSWVVEL
jgi:hypothetical protein